MPNRLKGEVPLELPDGRSFTLVLDHEALIAAEGLYEKPLARLMADAVAGFAGSLRAMFYGALRAHHPAVTVREASAVFFENMDLVGDALIAAGDAAFPDAAEGKDGGNPPAKARPAGKRSGGSGAKRGSSRKDSSGRPRARSG